MQNRDDPLSGIPIPDLSRAPEYLRIVLHGLLTEVVKDPSVGLLSYNALQALLEIAAARSSKAEKLEDEAPVEVPWWVVRELAAGWHKYKKAPPGQTFGEVLKIEGSGQGAAPLRNLRSKIEEHRWLAFNVAYVIDTLGVPIAGAIARVAELTGRSPDKVRSAWQGHREDAKRYVAIAKKITKGRALRSPA
ncbi:MAG: hypothetical protein FJX60_22800 [Alphaproteobacteria bacterium]|nr:hypothetical protein [Alphaproteobacteria bacterium]